PILKLRAIATPAGAMTVVLGPGWPGILLHEAIGHGLEGDFNRTGVRAFAGRLGQKVASELVTVLDDGTIPTRRGSLNVDDEGTPTSRNVLIDRGVLCSYMQDKLNARLMGMTATGNGRRESYAYPPMPRMTNTFMLAGEEAPEDILRSVKQGLYAVAFGGGQVDITSGKFVFSASEAYLVEDGRIGAPVKGATLIGSGPDVLTRVSRVGHDLKLDEGIGTGGKDGQSVPVGVRLPTIRVDGVTVGGTQLWRRGAPEASRPARRRRHGGASLAERGVPSRDPGRGGCRNGRRPAAGRLEARAGEGRPGGGRLSRRGAQLLGGGAARPGRDGDPLAGSAAVPPRLRGPRDGGGVDVGPLARVARAADRRRHVARAGHRGGPAGRPARPRHAGRRRARPRSGRPAWPRPDAGGEDRHRPSRRGGRARLRPADHELGGGGIRRPPVDLHVRDVPRVLGLVRGVHVRPHGDAGRLRERPDAA